MTSQALPGGQLTVGPKFIAEDDVEGYLFDCDGTLIDTMPGFFPSWPVACEKMGLRAMDENEFYGFAGKPLPDIVGALHQSQKGCAPSAEFVQEFLKEKKVAHAAHEAKSGPPPPIACVVEIARAAVASGKPVALATSGLRDHVEAHLAHAGLADLFNDAKGNLVCAAEVPNGKPAPDLFLEAAKRIGVDPARCRAYEDGESGLISAYRAGCHVIDVTQMDAYPMCDGLRRAKVKALAERSWL